jgi:TPR repeat protein
MAPIAEVCSRVNYQGMILLMRHRTGLGWWIYGLLLCGGLLWYYQVAHLKQRAARGEAQAEYTLAKRYWVGQLVHQDWAEALKWVHKAAQVTGY